MYTQVKINNIDVSSYCINWEVERTYGDVLPEMILKFQRGITDSLTLTEGQAVKVWRGSVTSTDEVIFDGYVEKYEPDGGTITVTAIDKIWDLVRKEVVHVYDSTDAFAGKISAIFEDLVETYGGLTCSVQDSGTTLILDKFICNHTDIFERCKTLADVMNWQFYYLANTDTVYFEPKGYTATGETLFIGNSLYPTTIIGVPKWQYDITQMVNNVTVVGAYQEIETTESGRIGTTTGYTTTSIQLNFVPISVKVYGDASNPPTTLKTGGSVNSTATYDYYVDSQQKKIYPKAGTTFTTNDYYEIRYSLATPIPINMYDQYSIDTYGEFKKTLTYIDIKSVADAEARGTNYLEQYSQPFIYATLKVKNSTSLLYGLDAGKTIQIVDDLSLPSVNKLFVINKIRIKWPGSYDEIDVGERFWRLSEFNTNVMEKLKRLEEQELANQEILSQLVTVDNKTSSPLTLKNRYMEVTTKTGADPEVLYWRKWKDNVYYEDFYDDTFKDATTTANWDTANTNCTFTTDQIAVSGSIRYNDGTITTAYITASKSADTWWYWLSADGGSHWESVTTILGNTLTLTFANPGTDLRWKIQCKSATGTLNQVTVYSYT